MDYRLYHRRIEALAAFNHYLGLLNVAQAQIAAAAAAGEAQRRRRAPRRRRLVGVSIIL